VPSTGETFLREESIATSPIFKKMGCLATMIITGQSDERSMYCPSCDRSIRSEDLEELNKRLKQEFGRDSLDRAECPVCGTSLIDTTKKKVR
jgi:hypothetical protein